MPTKNEEELEQDEVEEDDSTQSPIMLVEVKAERVENGVDFIRSINAKELPPLREVTIGDKSFLVQKVGAGDLTKILYGQWKDVKDETGKVIDKELDALATSDQLILKTISSCVVNSKREPIWKEGNVLLMMTGPKRANYAHYIDVLYDECCQENPTLLPTNSWKSMRRITHFTG